MPPAGSDHTSISAAMDLVPLPWTWGAAVAVEPFGAHLALVNFVSRSSSSASHHRDRCKRHPGHQSNNRPQLHIELGNQRVFLRNSCLTLGCACTQVSSSSSTAYIRHAQRCLLLYPSRGASRSQPFSGMPSHQRQDTLMSGVCCSNLHGELHEASLLRGPRDSLVAATCCLQR